MEDWQIPKEAFKISSHACTVSNTEKYQLQSNDAFVGLKHGDQIKSLCKCSSGSWGLGLGTEPSVGRAGSYDYCMGTVELGLLYGHSSYNYCRGTVVMTAVRAQ